MKTRIVHEDIIQKNLSKIRAKLPKDTKTLAVIKANAYGLGAKKIATLLKDKVDYFGVVELEEALALRKANIKTPILLLKEPDEITPLITHNIETIIHTESFITKLLKLNLRLNLHLKINTGMSRLGCAPKDTLKLAQEITKSPHLNLKGLMTHFASADTQESPMTNTQAQTFKGTIEDLNKHNIHPQIIHSANSATVQNFPEHATGMVRLGLALYDNTITIEAPILHIKKAPKNTPISYGSDYITKEDTHIAIIDAGYYDGIPTALKGKGKVKIKDNYYPLNPTITMNFTLVDIGPNPDCKEGDLAIFIEPQENSPISLKNVAKAANQNPRELLINLGS